MSLIKVCTFRANFNIIQLFTRFPVFQKSFPVTDIEFYVFVSLWKVFVSLHNDDCEQQLMVLCYLFEAKFCLRHGFFSLNLLLSSLLGCWHIQRPLQVFGCQFGWGVFLQQRLWMSFIMTCLHLVQDCKDTWAKQVLSCISSAFNCTIRVFNVQTLFRYLCLST